MAFTDVYKGREVNPDELMKLIPVEIFSVDGYKGILDSGQKLYTNQGWLRDLECVKCGATGYFVLGAYRSEEISALLGETPVKGRLVLPCSDCGTIFESYEIDSSISESGAL